MGFSTSDSVVFKGGVGIIGMGLTTFDPSTDESGVAAFHIL